MNRVKWSRWGEFALWLIGVCIFVFCAQLVIMTIATGGTILGSLVIEPTPTPIKETIELPVNTREDVFSVQQYSGYVTITIQGAGWMDSSTPHEAFRSFEADGSVKGFHGFMIDGEPLLLRVFTVFPPRLEGTHDSYRFLYYAGTEARRIPFRMVNGNPGDTSVFTVEITSQNLISSGGR